MRRDMMHGASSAIKSINQSNQAINTLTVRYKCSVRSPLRKGGSIIIEHRTSNDERMTSETFHSMFTFLLSTGSNRNNEDDGLLLEYFSTCMELDHSNMAKVFWSRPHDGRLRDRRKDWVKNCRGGILGDISRLGFVE
mmetsp:Transcript_17695/g.48974  ORF Transcript_17695/g.48974 Transcript_17695/m.48974 type:complete len:138 (-) Transcript_17695:3626-4039(-)